MLLIFPSAAHIPHLSLGRKGSSEPFPQPVSPPEIQTTNGLSPASYPEAYLAA